MDSFSAREARARSPIDTQLWASEQFDTSSFSAKVASTAFTNRPTHVKKYFEETAVCKESFEVYNDALCILLYRWDSPRLGVSFTLIHLLIAYCWCMLGTFWTT